MQLGYNPIPDLSGLRALSGWCPRLATLYLEASPAARDWEYRKAAAAAVPSLTQLDATAIIRRG